MNGIRCHLHWLGSIEKTLSLCTIQASTAGSIGNRIFWSATCLWGCLDVLDAIPHTALDKDHSKCIEIILRLSSYLTVIITILFKPYWSYNAFHCLSNLNHCCHCRHNWFYESFNSKIYRSWFEVLDVLQGYRSAWSGRGSVRAIFSDGKRGKKGGAYACTSAQRRVSLVSCDRFIGRLFGLAGHIAGRQERGICKTGTVLECGARGGEPVESVW
jgi:hypothetical protein